MFVFEDSPALQFGSEGRTRRETLLETAALLMMISAINRDRVGLLYSAPGNSWFQRALPGRKGITRIAATLLGQPAPSLDGPATCPFPGRSSRRARRAAACCSGSVHSRRKQCRRCGASSSSDIKLVGVRADDPWDLELPRNAKFSAYDPLAGRLTLLNTASSAERAAHAAWRERREEYFAEMFPRRDDRMIVGNVEDPLQSLIAWFHRHRHGGARS